MCRCEQGLDLGFGYFVSSWPVCAVNKPGLRWVGL
jgi:hypothetical protein